MQIDPETTVVPSGLQVNSNARAAVPSASGSQVIFLWCNCRCNVDDM